jgi:hypothetical protein
MTIEPHTLGAAGAALGRRAVAETTVAGELLGLRNLSPMSWQVRRPSGLTVEVATGRVVRLEPGLVIDFGGIEGVIGELNAAPDESPAPAPAAGRTAQVPTTRIDLVHFCVTIPPRVQRRQQFVVDVWAHLEAQRHEVERRIGLSAPSPERPPIIRQKGPFRIAERTTLFVTLKLQDLHVEPEHDAIFWDGEIGNACFQVDVPDDIKSGPTPGLVIVRSEGGQQIARVPIQVEVADRAQEAAPATQPIPRIRRAFASYAAEDRDEVLGRIQGMQKILPDLEVFLDVARLRSGQNWERELWRVIPQSDVFYLFWSAAAKASQWVEKEWRCALDRRGQDFIDPVPLVSPEVVPPPRELAEKHFGDWTLAFVRAKPAAPEGSA